MQRPFNRNLKRFQPKLFGNKGASFISEYQDIYDAFTTKPNAAVASAQNTMVKSLVDLGVWALTDIFWLMGGHTNDNGESVLNWVNPGTFDGVVVNSPTFTALEGFTGDGLTTRIMTNYIPSINGINYKLNSASIFVYARKDTGTDLKALCGGDTIPASQIITGSTFYSDINNANASIANTNVNTKGFLGASRTASNLIESYNNATKYTDVDVSTGVQNDELWVLARRGAGTGQFFTDNQISMFFVGGGLSEVQVTGFRAAFKAYMDSNGKGVIP